MLQPTQRAGRLSRTSAIITLVALSSLAASMELFQVKLVEQDNSRLIATSNYNYALASPKLLAKGWQTVSVNGDQVYITLASNGEQQVLSRSGLAPADLTFIEQLRDEIANSNSGYSHISTAGDGSGGGNYMMMSNNGGGGSGSSSSFSSSSTTSSFGGQYSSSQQSLSGGGGPNGISYNMRDDENFSVSRSDFPYNWSRVFFNGNTLTFVFRNGDVRMQPMSSLDAQQLETVNRLKNEVMDMKRQQTQQAAHTMQQSMDMVSNVFNNIMGQFPRPPDYQSAVGNMFGNNFPFGPNNSPFSAASGWPFGGSGGGAMAFASGRRR